MLIVLSKTSLAIPPSRGKVSSVYDGDTFTLSSGQKIRLRGVNTPEIRPMEDYGIEARDAVRKMIVGKDVYLSYGPVTVDGYDRLIAYLPAYAPMASRLASFSNFAQGAWRHVPGLAGL